jgi:hypothetical protein
MFILEYVERAHTVSALTSYLSDQAAGFSFTQDKNQHSSLFMCF